MTRSTRGSGGRLRLATTSRRCVVPVAALLFSLLLAPGAAWAGAWVGPTTLPSEWSGNPVALAGDGHGNAVALVSGSGGLATMSWPAGQALPEAPLQLSAGGSGASVAMDASGNAIAVWAEGSTVTSAFKPAGA